MIERWKPGYVTTLADISIESHEGRERGDTEVELECATCWITRQGPSEVHVPYPCSLPDLVALAQQHLNEHHATPVAPKTDHLTEQELDDWLLRCERDPSIVTPAEMGWNPDGTRRFPVAEPDADGNT